MADSNQLRSERRRRHARNDHGICRASCSARAEQARAAMRVVPDLAAVVEDDDQPGEQYGPAVEAAVNALGAMPFTQDDPRFLIAVTVLRMAQAFDAAPTAGLAGEMRRQIEWLLAQGLDSADKVAEIRARVAEKHAKLLIAHAFSTVAASG